MLSQLQRDSTTWFELALSRAPMELHSTLQVCTFTHTRVTINIEAQKYLATLHASSLAESSELGASIAVQWAKAIGPIDRKLCTLRR